MGRRGPKRIEIPPSKLRRLAKSGLTLREQAAELGISISTLRKRHNEAGIRRRRAWERVPVGMLYGSGTAAEIAARVGCSRDAVLKAARRHGITL